MPRYFFHTINGSREPDSEGTELQDVRTAKVEAIRLSGAMLRERPELLEVGREFRVEVMNETGTKVFEIATTSVDPSRN